MRNEIRLLVDDSYRSIAASANFKINKPSPHHPSIGCVDTVIPRGIIDRCR
jgi:hypothetical protein